MPDELGPGGRQIPLLQKIIVLDPEHARSDFGPVPVELGIELLPVLAGKVRLGGGVERLQRGGAGPPLEVVPDFVGQGLPGLLPPVEIRVEPGQGMEGAVIEEDAALDGLGVVVGNRERIVTATAARLVPW